MGSVTSKPSKQQANTVLKELVVTKRIQTGRGTNSRMMQNVLLIWLDADTDEKNTDNQNTLKQLKQIIHTVVTFNDAEKCIQFLEEIDDEKTFLIASSAMGKYILPRVHDMSQMDSIFIFCRNEQYHEEWAKQWCKIRGVFTDINLICDAIQQSARDCEHNATLFSVIGTEDNLATKNLDQLEPMFMYTQILKEILLLIHFEEKHILELARYSRETLEPDDKKELDTVKMLELEYHSQTPIWWYTSDSFLYRMLNRALYRSEIEVIIKMGFFLADLHRHIDQLHQKQFDHAEANGKFIAYRGQGMSKEQFEKISTSKGGLFVFNNFLSTSRTDTVAMDFLRRATEIPEQIGVLFAMSIDPTQATTPFACVNEVSYFQDKEDEVLFSMNTVFRIKDIGELDEDPRLFRVELELTTDNDEELQVLTERIREETRPDETEEGWSQLGLALIKLGKSKQAEEVFQTLLESESDAAKQAWLYCRLGICKYHQAEYEEAIHLYEKSIQTYENNAPKDPAAFAPQNNLGLLYRDIGENEKALSSLQKALAISEQTLPSNHPSLSSTYQNIGLTYSSLGDYEQARSFYEKTLAIQKESLPPNHPDLAHTYTNLGNLYFSKGEYANALSYHQKSLALQEQALPPTHPELGISHNNIATAYTYLGDNENACSSFDKALSIWQESLPSNHPYYSMLYLNLGNVNLLLGDKEEALAFYQKAAAAQEEATPSNPATLGTIYNNIGVVYLNLEQYDQALSYYEKALAIRKELYSAAHPDLAEVYSNFGLVYEKMGDIPKARSFFEKAVDIAQQTLPENHPNAEQWRENLARVQENC